MSEQELERLRRAIARLTDAQQEALEVTRSAMGIAVRSGKTTSSRRMSKAWRRPWWTCETSWKAHPTMHETS
jgi:hypothetical protein